MRKTFLISTLLLTAMVGASNQAQATAIANSNLSFHNFHITPANGVVSLLWDWEGGAFAEAKNSRGELDQDYHNSFWGGNVVADAEVTWAKAHGEITAPAFSPPDESVTGNAWSDVNCPGCDPKAASAWGRGWADMQEFMITGGVGPVNVDFSVDLTGNLNVFTDDCGLYATTEVIFGMELDGNQSIFFHDRLHVGSNDSDSRIVNEHLSRTVPLLYDVPYYMHLEVDSESDAAVVPEPATVTLMLAGISGLAGLGARKRKESPSEA